MSSARGSSGWVRQLLRHAPPRYRNIALALAAVLTALFGVKALPPPERAPATAAPRDALPAGRMASGWEKLTGVRLVEHRNNDGDSFRVRGGGCEFELRLYFADAPETYLSDRHPEQRARVAEQARELGLTVDETIAVGRKARDLVRELLAGREFTVYTQWERVYDSDRVHGFVELPDPSRPGKPVYLCEILCRKGLARVHTKGADTPDGRSWRSYREHLQRISPRQPRSR